MSNPPVKLVAEFTIFVQHSLSPNHRTELSVCLFACLWEIVSTIHVNVRRERNLFQYATSVKQNPYVNALGLLTQAKQLRINAES